MVKKARSNKQDNIVKMIAISIELWVVILTVFAAAIKFWEKDDSKQIIYLVAVAVLTCITFGSFKDKLVLFGLDKLKSFSPAEINICGNWRIEIEYESENNVRAKRIGEMEIYRTPLGLQIKGDAIRDSYTNATVVEEWTSEYVHLIETNKTLAIQYAFRIRRDTDKDGEYSKVGLVVIQSTDGKSFSGDFRDLLIPIGTDNNNEVKRNGSVFLQRA